MNEDKRNEIILKHIQLAFNIASRFKGVNQDDLIDLALYTLVREVEKFYNIENDGNVSRYLHSRIRFRILDYLRFRKIAVTISNWDDFVTKDNQTVVIEVRDTIERCCRNEFDKFIFDCKLKGMTDTEIAKEAGIHQVNITRTKNLLYSRFRVFWGEL